MALSIESIPDQAGKPANPLRQAWRGGKRVRRRTIASLPELPPTVTGGFRAVLEGAVAVPGTARGPGPERILHRTAGRERRLAPAAIVPAAIVPGVIPPGSRPATARRLSPETATDSLGALPDPGLARQRPAGA